MLANVQTNTRLIEASMIRKLRVRILPVLFLLYVVCFIDRVNIGFAALTMNQDLAISSQQFGLASGIFFFGYFLFEVPSNLLLHKIGARIWIARILITWGTVAVAMGFVRTVHQLYVVRFLLGLAEAGYFPGIVLYLSYWFPRRERAQPLALILVGLPIASIVGGPISGLILDHVHWLGISSWRWLLVLEGLPAIVGGVLTYFLLPNRPAEAKFLTTEEKEYIRADLLREEQQKLEQHHYSVFQAMTSGRVWLLSAADFGVLMGLYTLSFWTPQLLKSLSGRYSNTAVGFLVMIPNLAGLLGMVMVSRSSDRMLERRNHAALVAFIGGVALVLMGATDSPFFLIAFLSLLAVGVYSFAGPFWALPGEFLTGYSAAAGIGLINSIANLGGFAGPYAIGVMSSWTGSLSKAYALAGIPLFISVSLLLLLPKRAPVRTRCSGISAKT
jgi:D-galactonate transporter